MADEKKPDAKDAKSSPVQTKDDLGDMMWFLLALLLISSVFGGLINSLSSKNFSAFNGGAPTHRNVWLSLTKPISSLENPIGNKFVVTSNKASLYDGPDERKIAEKKLGDKGTITGGPVSIGEERYWQVSFEDGSTGWINEKDIAYLENTNPGFVTRTLLLFWKLVPYFKFVAIIFSFILIAWTVYLSKNLSKIRREERERLYPGGMPDFYGNKIPVPKNQTWERIVNHTDSLNENDWRLAILEADIILADLLDALSLPGGTIGDKLKAVEKSDFTTLDNAWEAHKIRNMIAHEGQSFLLNQREAKRVIELYRTVFEEFQII